MNIELLVQDNNKGTIYDISKLVSDIEWSTSFEEDQPGKLTFKYADDHLATISEGSPISFKFDNHGIFFGYVFKRKIEKQAIREIVAYDQMRYLKNKDTYVFSNMTASQIFAKVCSDFKLKYLVRNASSYKIAARVNDDSTLFEIIQHSIDETLINTSSWYMIYDNFGVLEFVNLNNLKSNLAIGDKSLLTDFEYESSIDDDTYNQVKLVKENKDTQKRELYIVKDSSNIKKWGTLQYFETVDENANEAQIKAKADAILKLKNRTTKKLSLECVGDIRVRAGVGVVLEISSLVDENIANMKYYIVTSCTHSFADGIHTMELDVKASV